LLFEIPGEWERISHCLNEIQDTSQPFEHCSHNSLRSFANSSLQLVDDALTLLSSTSFELDDQDQENHDSLDSWVHHLLTEVDHLLHVLKPLLVTSCFRAFLNAFEESLALRIEVQTTAEIHPNDARLLLFFSRSSLSSRTIQITSRFVSPSSGLFISLHC